MERDTTEEITDSIAGEDKKISSFFFQEQRVQSIQVLSTGDPPIKLIQASLKIKKSDAIH